MHRDIDQSQRREPKRHDRNEWDRLADDQHDLDDKERHARMSWRVQRKLGASREEAGRQIRELRARY